MAKIQTVVKGDVILERIDGKNRMTPVRSVDYNACSKPSVHINNNECYDWGTDVRLVEADQTLGDIEKEMSGLGDLSEEYEQIADKIINVNKDDDVCPRCGGDHTWCQNVRPDEYGYELMSKE